MDETIVKSFRKKISVSVVVSAIAAMIGAIGIFVIQGIFSISERVYLDNTMAITVIAVVCWDLVRLGAFGMFVCGLIFVIVELFGKARGKLYAFVLLGGSIFGFIGSLMLSMQSLIKSAMTLSMQVGVYSYGSSSSYTPSLSFIDIPCVFALISSVTAFIALGIKASSANKVYIDPQTYYQGYPQQGYPPQSYPQQGYPQQSYPQQETSMPYTGVDLTKSAGNDPTNCNQ